MKLGSKRDLFEIPEDIVYLNCAYMSPQLRPAREVGEKTISRKSRPWEITPDDFFEDAEEIRALFARLVGGDADGPPSAMGSPSQRRTYPCEKERR
jgi:hypothetical protein